MYDLFFIGVVFLSAPTVSVSILTWCLRFFHAWHKPVVGLALRAFTFLSCQVYVPARLWSLWTTSKELDHEAFSRSGRRPVNGGKGCVCNSVMVAQYASKLSMYMLVRNCFQTLRVAGHGGFSNLN